MLKTDYKDAMYDGARKYKITSNADGTSGITDETVYTQEGDPFGANDINSTNKAINRINGEPANVTLTASGWTGDAAPYSQTVEVEGVTAEDPLHRHKFPERYSLMDSRTLPSALISLI